ncbi:MAG: phosphoribosyltransferase [Nitrospirae bacterium]|nr:phosphoribosyltransferase [Nitrospirota bacterium]
MFKNRSDAGIQLASRLKGYKGKEGVLVLALPRGGVVTGYEIARNLNVPLDIIIVRKIGFPGQPELGIGAVSETATIVLNDHLIYAYGISKEYIESEISTQREEISRRVKLYRKGKSLYGLEDKTIILVDDGVATGATIKAAIATLKEEKINKLVVALPVASPSVVEEIEKMVDEFVCIETPIDFMAVGSYYYDFTQVSDEEVVKLLKLAAVKI